MVGEPFFIYERVNNYGPYGDLTTGINVGNPRSQSLDAKTSRIVASSHDGVTVMFWNDYDVDSHVQREGLVGYRDNGYGSTVGAYGPTGDSMTLGDVLDQLTWGSWIDSREILAEINE
jgi:hypothetical protein